jgi:hypothetical protein
VADAYLGAALTAPAQARAAPQGTASPSAPFRPDAADASAYQGRYFSEEAETLLTIAADGGDLVVKRRPDTVLRLRPVEKDIFTAPALGTITFRRSPDGSVGELSVKQDRVWDLRFQRAR